MTDFQLVDEMVLEESSSSSSSWSWEQEKAFESALAVHFQDNGDEDVQWELITEAVPGKTVEEVMHHYELLVEDINDIESGLVPLLSYASSSEGAGEEGGAHGHGKKSGGAGSSHGRDSGGGGKGSKTEQERRKGVAWTEDEHRLFLLGLDKYGKGDWRSISRNFVISRTPTQVASHAQKYFIRLNSMNKDRRRASIHDITSVGDNADASAAQGPITGQTNAPVAVPGGKPAKSSPQVGLYGTTIGQPIGGPLVPAVGTPVNIPVPGGPHMAYGMRAPLSGPVVTGTPMNLPPMTYPMHHASAHR